MEGVDANQIDKALDDGVADGDHLSRVEGDRLWDADGHEWTTKHTAWVTLKQANAFARRAGGGGLLEGPGQPVRWMLGEEMSLWWKHARNHYEVPGHERARADEPGRWWTAHLWRRGDLRLIVFETNC